MIFLIVLLTTHKTPMQHFSGLGELFLRSMCAHLALRLSSYPNSIVCEPQYGMEDAIEHWFSQVKTVKRDVKGSLTVASSISAAHLLHTRQRRKPREAALVVYLNGKI